MDIHITKRFRTYSSLDLDEQAYINAYFNQKGVYKIDTIMSRYECSVGLDEQGNLLIWHKNGYFRYNLDDEASWAYGGDKPVIWLKDKSLYCRGVLDNSVWMVVDSIECIFLALQMQRDNDVKINIVFVDGNRGIDELIRFIITHISKIISKRVIFAISLMRNKNLRNRLETVLRQYSNALMRGERIEHGKL